MSTEPRSRAWVEVDPVALRANLATVRTAAGPGVGVLPMVKADAYGIGLREAVRELEPESPWGYGVATVPEGVRIRSFGIERPVLVLTPAPRDAIAAALASRLTLCVSDVDSLEAIVQTADALGVEAAVHIDVDTGMGRSGFDWREVGSWGPAVGALIGGRVSWEGTFSHFHSADEPGAPEAERQAGRFRDTVAALRGSAPVGKAPEGSAQGGALLHLSNSAAALRSPEFALDLVRPGIFLYGGRAGEGLPGPEEVVRVCARVVLVREVPPGTTLGYGATYRASRTERWATLGIGYGDGVPRCLGNRGEAVVGGGRAPIIGRISMDLTVVDITNLPRAGVGDVATLIGKSGPAGISLDEVAGLAGTISYEILTGLTSRLPRVWNGEREAGESAEPGGPA